MALDAYKIDADGLTPLWDADAHWYAAPLQVTAREGALWARVHARVIHAAREAEGSGRWARVSVLAHYVACTEKDAEIASNNYGRKLPDVL